MADVQRMIPAQMHDQAALYLQIQQWLDLENKARELASQLEAAITDKAAADVRAETAIFEATQARADLAVAQKRITELEAEDEGEDDGENDVPPEIAQRLAMAESTVKTLSDQLQRKSSDDAALRQVLDALKQTGSKRQAPDKPISFDVTFQRDDLGRIAKTITITEKR